MFEPTTILVITLTFVLAGAVKGVIGLGLPTIALALLTIIIDLPSAMALLLVPSFVTNLWQGAVGGHTREIVVRLWPFLLAATASVWIGAMALSRIDFSALSALLGVLLVLYATVNLFGLRLNIGKRHEAWSGPLLGAVNGVLTGMTGSFVVPGVMYLQAIRLPRDSLIQAMGMLFTLCTLALAIALRKNDLLTIEQGTFSALALLPALGGMIVGQRVRQHLSPQQFLRIFFVTLLVLGIYILVNANGGFD